MITALRRVVKAGFVGFWRNSYVSFTSIYVIVIALFVIGCAMFLNQILTKSLEIVQSRIDINVYFVPEAEQADIDAIKSTVMALPEVRKVDFISREESLADYRERNKNNEVSLQALEELDENPLGASLRIEAYDISRYEDINTFLDEQQSQFGAKAVIDSVNYERNKKAIDAVIVTLDAVNKISLIVSSLLLVAAALITFNTISLVIFTSREEITIMRLVGASNMFIRGPFMLQGIMYGLISGVLALLLFYPMLVWVGPKTEAFFELNLFDYYITHFGEIFGILVGIGVVLGLISSILAVARYLRT